MKPAQLILFDLDGVLIDSKSNMEHAWNAVREEFPYITSTFEDYFAKIGRPFNDILILLGIVHDPMIQYVYNRASIANRHVVKPFNGVYELLGKLQTLGYILGIVTSKDHERTTMMLDDADISKFFDSRMIMSPTQDFRGKPAPDQLLHAMALANVDPANTIYVGDMHTDAQAASRAGCNFIFAPWGYSSETTRVYDRIHWMFEDRKRPVTHSAKCLQDIASVLSKSHSNPRNYS